MGRKGLLLIQQPKPAIEFKEMIHGCYVNRSCAMARRIGRNRISKPISMANRPAASRDNTVSVPATGSGLGD